MSRPLCPGTLLPDTAQIGGSAGTQGDSRGDLTQKVRRVTQRGVLSLSQSFCADTGKHRGTEGGREIPASCSILFAQRAKDLEELNNSDMGNGN